MLYGLIQPLILLFGACYFTIKYFVDKYNKTIVYPKLYESKGVMANHLMFISNFSLWFQQFLMLIMFTISLGRSYFKGSIITFMVI